MNPMRYWFDENHTTDVDVTERISLSIDMVFADLRKYHTPQAVNAKLGLTTFEATLAVKADWFNDFAVLTPRMIHKGLKKSTSQEWCPTLGQFIALCKPSAEAAFFEAQTGIKDRSNGLVGKWSCPAVYWAAVEFGILELKQAQWNFHGKRWTKCFNDAMDKQEAGKLLGIPDVVPQSNRVEYTPRTERTDEVAKKVEQFTKKTINSAASTAWAMRCKSLSAARMLVDGLNGVHRLTLSEAGKHHLSTGKVAHNDGVWKLGTYWGAA